MSTSLDVSVAILQATVAECDAAVAILQATVAAGSILDPTPLPVPTPPAPPAPGEWQTFTPHANPNYKQVLGISATIVDATSGSHPMSPVVGQALVTEYSFRKKRREPNSWSMKLLDRFRTLGPRATTPVPWAPSGMPNLSQMLLPQNYNSARYITRHLEVGVDGNGASWQAPWGIIQTYDYHAGIEGYEADISGTDYSHPLLQPNQSMAPWNSTSAGPVTTNGVTRGGLYTAKAIAAEILSMYRIPGWELNFNDYPIRSFAMIGEQPLDAIKKLLHVPVATWRFRNGATFSAWQPNTAGNPMWQFVDQENCEILDYKYSITGLCNMLTVIRSQSSSVLVGEAEAQLQSGFKTIKFKFPAKHCRVVAQLYGVHINDPLFPSVFLGPGGIVGPNGPATQYNFTAVQNVVSATPGLGTMVLNTAIPAYYHIWIYGEPAAMDDLVGSGIEDTTYTVNVRNQASINVHGPLPDKEPIENVLIPNVAWAQTHGIRTLDERFRLLETVALRTWCNPWIDPDDTASLNVGWLGLYPTDGVWCVESTDTTWNEDGGSTTVELSKYGTVTETTVLSTPTP